MPHNNDQNPDLENLKSDQTHIDEKITKQRLKNARKRGFTISLVALYLAIKILIALLIDTGLVTVHALAYSNAFSNGVSPQSFCDMFEPLCGTPIENFTIEGIIAFMLAIFSTAAPVLIFYFAWQERAWENLTALFENNRKALLARIAVAILLLVVLLELFSWFLIARDLGYHAIKNPYGTHPIFAVIIACVLTIVQQVLAALTARIYLSVATKEK